MISTADSGLVCVISTADSGLVCVISTADSGLVCVFKGCVVKCATVKLWPMLTCLCVPATDKGTLCKMNHVTQNVLLPNVGHATGR